MHKTLAGERRKSLIREAKELAKDAKLLEKVAHAPSARQEAQRLQGEVESTLAEAEDLKLRARLEDLTVWKMEKRKKRKKEPETYTYWMASWREGDRTRNVHLGSAQKIDAEEALQKAQKIKAEAIHVN